MILNGTPMNLNDTPTNFNTTQIDNYEARGYYKPQLTLIILHFILSTYIYHPKY